MIKHDTLLNNMYIKYIHALCTNISLNEFIHFCRESSGPTNNEHSQNSQIGNLDNHVDQNSNHGSRNGSNQNGSIKNGSNQNGKRNGKRSGNDVNQAGSSGSNQLNKSDRGLASSSKRSGSPSNNKGITGPKNKRAGYARNDRNQQVV